MSEWRDVTLRELCESVDYGLTASSTPRNTGVRFLRITDIVGSRFAWSSVPFVEAGTAKAEKYRLDAGDIVIARTGATTGESMWLASVPEPAVFASYLVRLKIRPDVDSRFVGYLLKAPAFRHYVQGVLGDKSAQPNASATTLTAAPLRIPADVSAQQATAAVLGALDDKIAVNDRIAETAYKLAAAEYSRVAQQAERACALGDVIELAYGKALPAVQRRPGPVAVYGSGGISGSHDQHLVRGPGIIVGRKGTVGSVYWSHRDFFPIDTTYYVKVTDDRLTIEYVYFLLTRLGLSEMNSDSAVPGLNRSRALAIPVHLPDGKVVTEFTESVRPLFAMREQMARENQTLTQLRDTLLPEFMSGRLRVKDVEKVIEEAV